VRALKPTPKPTEFEKRLRNRPGWTLKAELLPEALRRVILALAPLDFEEKRQVLAWAAETHSIDPTKLGQ